MSTENLTGMMVFAQVVMSGSFSAAAETLGMSKSSVSKKVSHLEDRLGVRLLNRTTRKLNLTEVGATFFERCERIMSEAEEAELAITRLQAEPRGTLRISAPVSFGIQHMAAPVNRFMSQHDKLRIDMTLNDRFVDLVEEGYDLALRIGVLPDSSLIARKITTTRRVICASPDYWKKHGKPSMPRDLEKHQCLIYSLLRNRQEWTFVGGKGEQTVNISGDFSANNGDMLAAAAIQGLGVLAIPAFIIGPALREGKLIPVLEDYEIPPVNIYAVYPHSKHLSAKVKLFVDYLASWFGDTPSWEIGETVPVARRD